MAYPKLRVPYASRQMVDVFKGYNHNLRIGDGEFYDMKNLTSDDYPVLSPRTQRGFYKKGVYPGGMIAKDCLCYVNGTDFVINEYPMNMGLTEGEKQLISMGAYVIILPDKKYVNTLDLTDCGNIEAELTTEGDVTFSICKQDGSIYDKILDVAPEDPKDGDLWLDTSTSPNALKQWSKNSAMWIQIATTYVKIAATGIGKAFALYDGIEISGLSGNLGVGDDSYKIGELAELEGAAVVWDKGDDYITIVGILANTWTINSPVTITRKMPKMDFVIEAGNRLWGCRYGTALNGNVVNEIYCSKLGDFKNWNCFMGIATDSWVGQLGTDGPFTGAVTHLGYPVFFKENCLHKVYISSNGAHQIVDTACRGVQKGCNKSLAIVNEVLYYKARSGVCAYDGSLPAEVSSQLGNVAYSEAVGGSHGNKYYVSMKDADNKSNLFVYDTAKALWHREDNFRAVAFCSCENEMYAVDAETGDIVTLFGSGDTNPAPVGWMAESGIIGLSIPDMKYISRLILRLTLPEGSSLSCLAEYDSKGNWKHLFTVHGHGTTAFTLPVRPVRCDHMRLRLEGCGPMKLFSITKTIEQGSDVR